MSRMCCGPYIARNDALELGFEKALAEGEAMIADFIGRNLSRLHAPLV